MKVRLKSRVTTPITLEIAPYRFKQFSPNTVYEVSDSVYQHHKNSFFDLIIEDVFNSTEVFTGEPDDKDINNQDAPEAFDTIEEIKELEIMNEPGKDITVIVEEVKIEEPKIEEIKIEESKIEEVKVEKPKIEEVNVEEPKVSTKPIIKNSGRPKKISKK